VIKGVERERERERVPRRKLEKQEKVLATAVP